MFGSNPTPDASTAASSTHAPSPPLNPPPRSVLQSLHRHGLPPRSTARSSAGPPHARLYAYTPSCRLFLGGLLAAVHSTSSLCNSLRPAIPAEHSPPLSLSSSSPPARLRPLSQRTELHARLYADHTSLRPPLRAAIPFRAADTSP